MSTGFLRSRTALASTVTVTVMGSVSGADKGLSRNRSLSGCSLSCLDLGFGCGRVTQGGYGSGQPVDNVFECACEVSDLLDQHGAGLARHPVPVVKRGVPALIWDLVSHAGVRSDSFSTTEPRGRDGSYVT